jgi:TonB-linked SusC/RagA family outer membrane protein
LGDPTTAYNDGYDGESSLASAFGRVFYSFDDRYLLTATMRRDGSSKFGRNKRWGWFPSAAFAWKISNENFLKDHPVINNLKLRLGYGLVGNQASSASDAYIASYGTSATNWGTGLIASNIPNPDLEWESTSSGNIGLDLNLFRNRIEFIADLYYKKTNNLLMEASLPGFAGTSGQGALRPPWVNLGSLENKGIELTLNTVNIDSKDFLWRSNFIFSLNRNKVRSINTVSGIITGRTNGNAWGVTESVIVNRTMVGRPIGEFYGYQVIGRFEKATDFYYTDENGNVKNTPVTKGLEIDENAGVWIGDYIYKDQDGNGVIDENDRAVIGNPEPKFTFGIGNTFSYKGFDLTISLSGSYGNDVINYARRYMENPYRNTSNLFKSALDYARLELIDPAMGNDYRNIKIVGGDSHSPRLALGTNTSNHNFAFSDRFIEDGSYLRIQNISFGYNLPRTLISKAGIQNMKVYTNIQNLYTFTKYKGYDPEVGSTYIDGNWLTGYDDGRYPSPRIYTVGVNITF